MFIGVWRFFNNIRIKKKLLLLFIIGVVLPLVTIISIFSVKVLYELNKREDSLANGELQRIKASISSMALSAQTMANNYAVDSELSWALETFSDEVKTSLSVIRGLDKRVLADITTNSFIEDIHIYYDNEELFDTVYLNSLSNDIANQQWYTDLFGSGTLINTGYYGEPDSGSIIISRKLNALNYESKNVLKITVTLSEITKLFDAEFFNDGKCDVFLLDNKGNMAASNGSVSLNAEEIAEKQENNKSFVSDCGDNSMLEGWKIVVIENRQLLSDMFGEQTGFLVITLMLALSLTLVVFYFLLYSIIYRLELIANVIETSGDNELAEVQSDIGRDEIGEMAEKYNFMVNRIKALVNEITQARDEVDALLDEKIKANGLLSTANADLEAANEELSTSLTEIQIRDERIQELVYVDPLTGLDNRYSISNKINFCLSEIAANKLYAFAFLDIDNFKNINDTYGHDVGDEVIKIVGSRLSGRRSTDCHIGRFGGDEFVIFIDKYSEIDRLIEFFNEILIQLSRIVVVKNLSFMITVSIGISVAPLHGKTRHELFKNADIALYKAKETGKNRVVLYDETMKQELNKKIDIQKLIQKALKENNFLLHYQPYYGVDGKTLRGCEALIRWKPESGISVSPYELIRSAEEMGIIDELGDWILKEACLFAKRLNENRETPVKVSINISAAQFMKAGFYEKVMAVIKEYQVNPKQICLEMTETILMSSIDRGSQVAQNFINQGFEISLDDFGTGYSSLRYFKDLPINNLKIDKGFIDNIAKNDYDKNLVDAMITLAHSRNISVIAEGVELEGQFSVLENLNCDIIQGYLFSRPIPESEFMKKTDNENPSSKF